MTRLPTLLQRGGGSGGGARRQRATSLRLARGVSGGGKRGGGSAPAVSRRGKEREQRGDLPRLSAAAGSEQAQLPTLLRRNGGAAASLRLARGVVSGCNRDGVPLGSPAAREQGAQESQRHLPGSSVMKESNRMLLLKRRSKSAVLRRKNTTLAMTNAPCPPITYWVTEGHFLAGKYPRHKYIKKSVPKLPRLLGLGVMFFVDLAVEGELEPCDQLLKKASDGALLPLEYRRFPIQDVSTPEKTEQMTAILDAVDSVLSDGLCVYVHCWGGVGQTLLLHTRIIAHSRKIMFSRCAGRP